MYSALLPISSWAKDRQSIKVKSITLCPGIWASDQETTSQSLQVIRPRTHKKRSCRAVFSYFVTRKAENAYLLREKNEDDT